MRFRRFEGCLDVAYVVEIFVERNVVENVVEKLVENVVEKLVENRKANCVDAAVVAVSYMGCSYYK